MSVKSTSLWQEVTIKTVNKKGKKRSLAGFWFMVGTIMSGHKER